MIEQQIKRTQHFNGERWIYTMVLAHVVTHSEGDTPLPNEDTDSGMLEHTLAAWNEWVEDGRQWTFKDAESKRKADNDTLNMIMKLSRKYLKAELFDEPPTATH